MEKWMMVLMLPFVIAVCPANRPDGLAICADFEESDNTDETVWGHYLETGFAEGIQGKSERFMLDSDGAYDGLFSIRSMDPNGHILNDYDTDTFFVMSFDTVFGRDMTYGDELFIRYAARFPEDWAEQATDSNGGANHLRINGNNNRGIEATFYGGWFHWYDTGVQWFSPVFEKDDAWHEYAFYLQMPSSQTASDGVFRIWKDSTEYTESNAVYSMENAVQTEDFNRLAVLTPCYYKGPVEGNWVFWLDDIEVWDRIPGSSCTSQKEICGNGIDEDCDGSDLECNTDNGCPDPLPEGMVWCEDFDSYSHEYICSNNQGDCDRPSQYTYFYGDISSSEEPDAAITNEAEMADSSNLDNRGFRLYVNPNSGPTSAENKLTRLGLPIGQDFYLRWYQRLNFNTQSSYAKIFRIKVAPSSQRFIFDWYKEYNGKTNLILASAADGFNAHNANYNFALEDEYQLDTWMCIEAFIDQTNNEWTLWVNDEDKGSVGLPPSNYDISGFSIGGNQVGQGDSVHLIDYDNIAVSTQRIGCDGQSCSDADNDCSGDVSITELVQYMDLWKYGQKTIQQVMQAIQQWKTSS